MSFVYRLNPIERVHLEIEVYLVYGGEQLGVDALTGRGGELLGGPGRLVQHWPEPAAELCSNAQW